MNDLDSDHCRRCDHAMADHSADETECEWCPEGEPWEDAWHGRVRAYLGQKVRL